MLIYSCGFRHARELISHFQYWLNKFNITNIRSTWEATKYPTDIDHRSIIRVNVHSNKIILVMGQ